MNKTTRRILSIALTLCMIASLVPMTALAANEPLEVLDGAGLSVGVYVAPADALAALETGYTLKLTSDFNAPTAVLTLDVDEEYTFDLNGKTIAGLRISAGTVTVTGNGKVNSADSTAVVIADSTVTINDGTFTSSNHDAVIITDSTVTINAGTFTSVFGDAVDTRGSTVTINGGTFSGDDDALFLYSSTVTLAGGTFETTDDIGDGAIYNSGSSVTIPVGYVSIPQIWQSAETVQVVPGTPVDLFTVLDASGASVGAYPYLAEAQAVLGDGYTLKLTSNFNTAAVVLSFSVDVEYTIDLNGKTIAGLQIAYGNVTVTGNGTVTSARGSAFYASGCILTIENGTFTSVRDYALIAYDNDITFAGGTFVGIPAIGLYNCDYQLAAGYCFDSQFWQYTHRTSVVAGTENYTKYFNVVGDKAYDQLADAISAIESSAGAYTTIELTEDIILPAGAYLSLNSNADLVFDLGGHSISSNVGNSATLYTNSGAGSVTITGNGTVSNAGGQALFASNTGGVIVVNGTFNALDRAVDGNFNLAAGSAMLYASRTTMIFGEPGSANFSVLSGSTLTLHETTDAALTALPAAGGTLTLLANPDETVVLDANKTYTFCYGDNSLVVAVSAGNVTIAPFADNFSGGVFSSGGTALTVTGGTVYLESAFVYSYEGVAMSATGGGKIVVNSAFIGTFSAADGVYAVSGNVVLGQFTGLFDEPGIPVDAADLFTRKAVYALECYFDVDGDWHALETVSYATAEAEAPVTVKLLRDLSLNDNYPTVYLPAAFDITLDLNGHKITSNAVNWESSALVFFLTEADGLTATVTGGGSITSSYFYRNAVGADGFSRLILGVGTYEGDNRALALYGTSCQIAEGLSVRPATDWQTAKKIEVYKASDNPGGSSGGTTSYTVTFDANGGSAVASQRIVSGSKAVKPADPTRDGFTFTGWFTDASGTLAYSFDTAVTANLTLYAAWTPAATENPFNDVSPDDWFYDDVRYVYEKGLMIGVGGDTFGVNLPVTRAMLVTILWRMEGEPAVTTDNPFTDLEAGSWYEKAVLWAAANEIVKGFGDGTFRPNDPITREQFAAILYRYSEFKDRNVSTTASLDAYTDADQVSDWALTEMRWANGAGLITGRTDTTLVPGGTATRAEAAAILHRYLMMYQ